jgi:hypothetical protein
LESPISPSSSSLRQASEASHFLTQAMFLKARNQRSSASGRAPSAMSNGPKASGARPAIRSSAGSSQLACGTSTSSPSKTGRSGGASIGADPLSSVGSC